MRVPVGISNRHIELSQKDTEILFGKGFTFTKLRDLTQPGYFAAKECVTLKGPKGEIKKVRILGPLVKQTQVKILTTDAFKLGIDAPIRVPGDLKGSAGITIIGPKGEVKIDEGVIIAKRHLYMTVADSQDFGLENGQEIKIRIGDQERGLIFDNVVVKVRDDYILDCYIDREEGNAAGLGQGAWGEIIT